MAFVLCRFMHVTCCLNMYWGQCLFSKICWNYYKATHAQMCVLDVWNKQLYQVTTYKLKLLYFFARRWIFAKLLLQCLYLIAVKEESSDYPVAHVAGGTVGGVSLGLTIAVFAFVVFMKLRQQRPGLCYFTSLFFLHTLFYEMY